MNQEELYKIHQVSEKATEALWTAWLSVIDKKTDSGVYMTLAKGRVQVLHEMLFPEQYENVVSEVAARQAEIRDVKHEMD